MPGLANVLITGLTVLNANFEGILVTNTSYVVIANNHVCEQRPESQLCRVDVRRPAGF